MGLMTLVNSPDHGLHTGAMADSAGFFMKYFQRGGGYYIDVGCSQLIIDGKIKIKQGQEIEEVKPHGLLFADGTEVSRCRSICSFTKQD